MRLASSNGLSMVSLLLPLLLLLLSLIPRAVSMAMHPNTTGWQQILDKYLDEEGDLWEAKKRGRRAITDSDAQLILDLHNKLRGQVYPQASNMEYMEWDTELERTAEEWAETCLWEHGPAGLLPQIGQNLGAHWGRYRPPTSHVQAWYDEVKDYSFPYPQECNPYCPFRCSGPVCTHYTQLVWATSSRIGCAVNLCYNMNVWGQNWAKAVYLVCNYSPKGNWWGHAPYKHGAPCSACPPSYGGGCKDNLCYKGHNTPEETEENNFIEPEPPRTTQRVRPRISKPETPSLPATKPHMEDLPKNEVVNEQQMSQLMTCDTKLRDQCKGTTCNRYECPAGCLDATGKVVGTVYYEMQSSVCRAGLHAGVIDNDGGWMDVTREGRKDFFIKSNKNGVQSLGKYQSANSFTVSRVAVKAITCETTVAQLCPYQRPAKHCPRLYCPRNCIEEKPNISRVIGTRIYSDKSSICRAAVHAGVVRNNAGGYIDVMPVDKRKLYIASDQNGVVSESLQNPPGGKAFRVFAVI
ncbi:cysteine-rich secretory protein LCCL domain-containing 1-like [Corythoichthys intestinalis]|uniref:cysteine-rich secretory protein LCCL domain-containing 1-like n=1 Tax=Corythoichthys intestinalis TaxID=161448 RepID=UPI0025A50EF6|nr:cysteine-rich secretory protein LCCL domain-containing 1-like [Corythoichthys intestinalis]XP_061811644.1 cysteine-rich secretory protein LCCL domain-containing 1-like [Nerophis lumbriciformis]